MRQILYTQALLHLVCACPNTTPPAPETKILYVDAVSRSTTAIYVYWETGPDSVNEHQEFEVSVTPGVRSSIITTRRDVSVEDLEPSTEYEFYVYLRQKDGSRKEPGVKATTTTWASDDFNPQNATAEALSSSTIRLKWEAVKRTDRASALYMIVVNMAMSIESYDTTITVPNLETFSLYAFKIFSVRSDGSLNQPGAFVMTTTKAEVAEVQKAASAGSKYSIKAPGPSLPSTQ